MSKTHHIELLPTMKLVNWSSMITFLYKTLKMYPRFRFEQGNLYNNDGEGRSSVVIWELSEMYLI